MSDLQRRYDAVMTLLEPMVPPAGRQSFEYAAAMQAFLTCAVTIGAECYRVPAESARVIICRHYAAICAELKDAANILN